MSVADTMLPICRAIVVPTNDRVPDDGRLVSSIADRLSPISTSRNPKLETSKVYGVSSRVVSVLLVPLGASLTLFTVRLKTS